MLDSWVISGRTGVQAQVHLLPLILFSKEAPEQWPVWAPPWVPCRWRGVGTSCGLTKDHCCPGVSGAKRKGSQGPGSSHLRSLSTGQTHEAAQTHAAHTHTHRATQRGTSTQPTERMCANRQVHGQPDLPTHTHHSSPLTHTTQLRTVRTSSTLTSQRTIQGYTTKTPMNVQGPRRQHITTP